MGFGDMITFQAPERMRGSGDMDTYPHRTDATHSALLPGGQYYE